MFILDIITWRPILSENGIRAFWCQNMELNHLMLQYILSFSPIKLPSFSKGVTKSALLPTQMKSPTRKILLSQKPINEQNI